MRKFYVLFIMLLVYAIISCTIPSSIEVTGSPSLRFAANMDLSAIFESLMEDAFTSDDGNNEIVRTILRCTNDSFTQQTFLIHVNLFDKNLDIGVDDYDIPEEIIISGNEIGLDSLGNNKYKPNSSDDISITSSGDRSINFGLSEVQDYLQGFKIKDGAIKSMLYISGGDIIDECEFVLQLRNPSGEIANSEIKIRERTGNKSNINLSESEYKDNNLPAGGRNSSEFNVFISKLVDFEIDYEIFLRKDAEFEIEWLRNPPAKIEFVIMIELQLEVAANDGAELKLEDFEEIGGFLTSLPDLIQTVDLNISMNENPFKEGKLIIRDLSNNNYSPIINDMGENSLNIVINEKQMANLTNTEKKFEPEIYFFFDKGKSVYLNKDIRIMTVSLEANICYEMEL